MPTQMLPTAPSLAAGRRLVHHLGRVDKKAPAVVGLRQLIAAALDGGGRVIRPDVSTEGALHLALRRILSEPQHRVADLRVVPPRLDVDLASAAQQRSGIAVRGSLNGR